MIIKMLNQGKALILNDDGTDLCQELMQKQINVYKAQLEVTPQGCECLLTIGAQAVEAHIDEKHVRWEEKDHQIKHVIFELQTRVVDLQNENDDRRTTIQKQREYIKALEERIKMYVQDEVQRKQS